MFCWWNFFLFPRVQFYTISYITGKAVMFTFHRVGSVSFHVVCVVSFLCRQSTMIGHPTMVNYRRTIVTDFDVNVFRRTIVTDFDVMSFMTPSFKARLHPWLEAVPWSIVVSQLSPYYCYRFWCNVFNDGVFHDVIVVLHDAIVSVMTRSMIGSRAAINCC